MSTGYDYTIDDVDNYCLPDYGTIDKTAQEIKDDNNFEVPPGEQILMVADFPFPIRERAVQVMLDGSPNLYRSGNLCVRFCLPDNDRKTIDEYIQLPPLAESERNAYYYGATIDPATRKAKGRPGFEASKFYDLVSALGYDYQKGAPLPPDARLLGNWKGRLVKAVVQAASPYTDANGVKKDGKARIKLFSYERVPQPGTTSAPAAPAFARPPAASTAAPARPAAAPRAAVPAGIDDI